MCLEACKCIADRTLVGLASALYKRASADYKREISYASCMITCSAEPIALRQKGQSCSVAQVHQHYGAMALLAVDMSFFLLHGIVQARCQREA